MDTRRAAARPGGRAAHPQIAGMAVRAGFLMDPLDAIRVGHDSTFLLMLECQRRGWEVWAFEQRRLGWRAGGAAARMRAVALSSARPHFRVLAELERPLADLDVLFLRKDPPVDRPYLWATLLAELAGGGPLVVNDPAGLRDANEKLFALRFPDLVPESRISSDPADLADFCRAVGGEAVVKPLDGYGGAGVFRLRTRDPNLPSILETATRGGSVPALAQAFVPESRGGDKRILLVGGEPAGAVLRVPGGDDFRCNFAAGGRPERARLTDRDLAICARLAPELRRRGLHFVGIDVLGPFLTEVNVTSPTGIAEIDALERTSVEARLLDHVEELRAEGRAGTAAAPPP